MFSLLFMVSFFQFISLIQLEFYLLVFLFFFSFFFSTSFLFIYFLEGLRKRLGLLFFFLNNWLASCSISFVLILKYHNILSFKFKQRRRTKLYLVTVSTLLFFDLTTKVCSISVGLINIAPGKIVIKEGIYCIFNLLFIWSRMLFWFI